MLFRSGYLIESCEYQGHERAVDQKEIGTFPNELADESVSVLYENMWGSCGQIELVLGKRSLLDNVSMLLELEQWQVILYHKCHSFIVPH